MRSGRTCCRCRTAIAGAGERLIVDARSDRVDGALQRREGRKRAVRLLPRRRSSRPKGPRGRSAPVRALHGGRHVRRGRAAAQALALRSDPTCGRGRGPPPPGCRRRERNEAEGDGDWVERTGYRKKPLDADADKAVGTIKNFAPRCSRTTSRASPTRTRNCSYTTAPTCPPTGPWTVTRRRPRAARASRASSSTSPTRSRTRRRRRRGASSTSPRSSASRRGAVASGQLRPAPRGPRPAASRVCGLRGGG